MKKILLMLLFILVAHGVYSQDPWNPTRTYCEIVGTGNLTGTKVKVEIDFGQAKKVWTAHVDNFLVDENGKEIKFNSMVDAMNYMALFGWKFEQAYVITESSGMSKQNVYHYLLSKELDSENNNSGIYTRKDYKDDQAEEKTDKEDKPKKEGFFKKEKGKVDDIY